MRRAALLQVIREDTPARVWRVPDGGITAEPAWRAISTLAPVLKAIYGHLGCSRAVPVTFGCDCTGCDAPGQAWLSVGRCLEHLGIMKLELLQLQQQVRQWWSSTNSQLPWWRRRCQRRHLYAVFVVVQSCCFALCCALSSDRDKRSHRQQTDNQADLQTRR